MTFLLLIALLLAGCRGNANLWTVESNRRPFIFTRSASTFTQRRSNAFAVRGGAILQQQGDKDASSTQAKKDVNKNGNDAGKDDDDEDEVEATPAKTSSSHKPVPVTIQTATGHKVLDHTLELTVNRSRDIASLKDSIRRQLPGRPPVATMELVCRGKRLTDNTIVDELVDDEEDDDDDDEDDEERNSFGLVLQLDMVPPIDPKFLPQLQQEIPHWTTAELLEAYAANEAVLYQNAATLFPPRSKSDRTTSEDDEDEEEHSNVDTNDAQMLIAEQIRQQAERIHTQWKTDLLTSSKSKQLLADPVAPSEQSSLQATQVRGQRVRQVAVTGVSTSLKLQLQRQFNIDWAVSIRSFCLFLFFGWFGGKTPTSRAILLLGAPAVFVLQARQVQLVIKQILYFVLLKPPGIVLSLLPAPQQMILVVATKTADAMERIYGPDELGGDTISERIRTRTSASPRIDVPLKKLSSSSSLSDNELDNFVESLISEVDDDDEDDNEDSESDGDDDDDDEE